MTSMTATAPPQAASPQRARAADAVTAVAVASLVVVLGLWAGNDGLRDLGGGVGDLLTSLGRLTGLVAADLLLLQVVAMARVPWVEQAFGQDRLARLHRLAGFTSFHLMLVHIGLITLGYAAPFGSGTGALGQLWHLVVDYPGMLLAAAGTGLMVLVVVTSVRAARRRLRYESWHLIHLYGYLGAGLALPHQLWNGTDFTASPVARAYWWGLWGLALGSVLAFRLGLPLVRTVRHRLTVAAVVDEAPGVVSLHLRGRSLDRLPVRAGQFLVWRFLDGPGWSRGHPYSLSAAPHPVVLRITVKDLGDGSRRLGDVRPGSRVVLEGPYGRLTGAARTRRRITMVGAGIGITPLRALLEELPYGAGEATLLYRAGSESDLVFRHEIDQLAAQRGIRVVYLTGPRSTDPSRSWLPAADHGPAGGAPGWARLRELVPGIEEHDMFVCGPPAWAEAVGHDLFAAGVPAAQVHTESFSW